VNTLPPLLRRGSMQQGSQTPLQQRYLTYCSRQGLSERAAGPDSRHRVCNEKAFMSGAFAAWWWKSTTRGGRWLKGPCQRLAMTVCRCCPLTVA